MNNNEVLLNVAGLNILISTAEEETYTQSLAKTLDEDISAIVSASVGASVTNAAILCAIDYLDSSRKATKNANSMRTQIREYLTDAAAAKQQYDEEHKRANELSAEIATLRSHLTRLATESEGSPSSEKLKKELETLKKELAAREARCSELENQNKALTDKATAMNTYISTQDADLARVNALNAELNALIVQKDTARDELSERLEHCVAELEASNREAARLKGELDILEQMIAEESTPAPTEQTQPASAPEQPLEPQPDFVPAPAPAFEPKPEAVPSPALDPQPAPVFVPQPYTPEPAPAFEPSAPVEPQPAPFVWGIDANAEPAYEPQPAQIPEPAEPVDDILTDCEPFVSEPEPVAFSDRAADRPKPFDYDASFVSTDPGALDEYASVDSDVSEPIPEETYEDEPESLGAIDPATLEQLNSLDEDDPFESFTVSDEYADVEPSELPDSLTDAVDDITESLADEETIAINDYVPEDDDAQPDLSWTLNI